MAISTDYRDNRKAAYQQYAVVSDFNACRLPDHIKSTDAAPLGVAFVAAALALGICMGMDFGRRTSGPRGPSLLRNVQSVDRDALPKDIQQECFDSIKESEGAKAGDWIAIWGGKEFMKHKLQEEFTDNPRLIGLWMLRCSTSQTCWSESNSYY